MIFTFLSFVLLPNQSHGCEPVVRTPVGWACAHCNNIVVGTLVWPWTLSNKSAGIVIFLNKAR